MSPALAIRPARADELDAVKALVDASWRQTYAPIIGDERVAELTASRHARDLLGRQHQDAPDGFLVAEREGTILGHAYAVAIDDALYLDRLHVVGAAKSKGIGSALLAHVEALAAAALKPSVRLEMMVGNEDAKRFYERSGYVVTQHLDACGGELGIPALVMEKAL